MKPTRTVLIALIAAGLGALLATHLRPSPEPLTTPATTRFPIVSRVELQRPFGYFIGDEIPLTLVVETPQDVVIDLVNLPRKGEQHGPFEVRNVTLHATSPRSGRRGYRADYTLQYFGVTPRIAQFDGVEILYARPEDRLGPDDRYHYRSLITQPVTISLSRLGPYGPTTALGPKGLWDDRRSGLVWASSLVGLALFLAGSSGWWRQWRRAVRQRKPHAEMAPDPLASTLQTLRQEGHFDCPHDQAAFPWAERLADILRHHVDAILPLPVASLTTAELATHLESRPGGSELLYLLERCDALKYQLPCDSQAEAQQLWWEALALFEKFHQGAPP